MLQIHIVFSYFFIRITDVCAIRDNLFLCWTRSNEMESRWTVEIKAEAVWILKNYIDIEKNRRYYQVRDKFELIDVTGVQKVRHKCDQCIMAIKLSHTDIIQDVHVASGHKGETKTHKKIQ